MNLIDFITASLGFGGSENVESAVRDSRDEVIF
jgi:hypothetical protein